MQPVVCLADKIRLQPAHLEPERYVRFLAHQLSHDEAASRLRSLHQSGFQSAFYDRDRLVICFHRKSEFQQLCEHVGDTPETVERKFLSVSPSEWDPMVNQITHDPVIGLFNFCIDDAKERERLQRVPICMANCQFLNAGAIPVPSGGECILLHSGITSGGDLARILYSFSSDDASSLTREDMTNAMKGFLAVARHVTVGESDIESVASGIALADTERSESGLDTRGTIINMFVLMHEYGHVQLDHLEVVRDLDISTLSDSQRKELFHVMRSCEYKADSWAYRRLMEADWSSCAFERDPDGRITAALGICLVFEFLHLAEAFRDSGESALDTHPPARNRKQAFLDYCRRWELGSDMDWQATVMQKFVDLFPTLKVDDFPMANRKRS